MRSAEDFLVHFGSFRFPESKAFSTFIGNVNSLLNEIALSEVTKIETMKQIASG